MDRVGSRKRNRRMFSSRYFLIIIYLKSFSQRFGHKMLDTRVIISARTRRIFRVVALIFNGKGVNFPVVCCGDMRAAMCSANELQSPAGVAENSVRHVFACAPVLPLLVI